MGIPLNQLQTPLLLPQDYAFGHKQDLLAEFWLLQEWWKGLHGRPPRTVNEVRVLGELSCSERSC